MTALQRDILAFVSKKPGRNLVDIAEAVLPPKAERSRKSPRLVRQAVESLERMGKLRRVTITLEGYVPAEETR